MIGGGEAVQALASPHDNSRQSALRPRSTTSLVGTGLVAPLTRDAAPYRSLIARAFLTQGGASIEARAC